MKDGADWGFSTYFWVFRLLGRDFRTGELGISTFSAVFRILGRDFRTAAVGISTFSQVSRLLGRDFTIGGYRNLYLFPGFSTFWVEISNRQYWESLPFSRDFRLLGRDFRMAEVWWLHFAATSSHAHPFAQKIV